ncbi:hypothetical protein AGABI2DRAFT_179373 [Agaricus bisporus var. bisporus H97]|uniref:hypothetical protein n=1 Tax=Agaricus bisporus var. bisporus (strain H97 / ATCC MYA-4626 / FGSC 10389) TaxID=936046 RepID=UPI00029F6D85|nr:hypothetical protein AGABI2DRAFT_179373 [Agaricus bisporus var. bisporus H97]EKV45919.1 hypothetical protein AGABI2DRAFT_179373 [Agaricus bisporus var. bisporus H97]
MAVVQSQPSTVNPSLRAILTLPFRLCNPPPAVGKVRSFGVTPLFNVRLDDVLDRKHLPPLGLKDFEEWLLYVEMCAENLYFILWLRDYRARYAEWQRLRKSPSDTVFAPTTASRLATFYSRAKNTFFVPDSNYELNLSASLLSPFQIPDQGVPPDPSLFQEIEKEIRLMLEQSLRQFIQGQLINVGNRRVLCGIIASILIILVGFLPPIVANFVGHHSRFLRLAAVPGLWIGLTILLCALHGVCLGVYILGDLRQLRKFELARPAPSKKPNVQPWHYLPPQPLDLPSSPAAVHGRSHIPRQKRPVSSISVSGFSDAATSIYSRETLPFSMAPGYTEAKAIEGSSTCPILLECSNPMNDTEGLRQGELRKDQERRTETAPRSPDSFSTTATFILPFRSHTSTDVTRCWDAEAMSPQWYHHRTMDGSDNSNYGTVCRQPMPDFDFDGLPPVRAKRQRADSPTDLEFGAAWNDFSRSQDLQSANGEHSGRDDEERSRWKWLLDFIDRVQTRCSFKKWGSNGEDDSGPAFLGGLPPYLSSQPSSHRSHSNVNSKSTLSLSTYATTDTRAAERVKKQSRLVNAVPAFAVPLTQILSPVIRRGQWEIVVRSAGFAFVITWVICAALLAIPR